MTTEQLVGFIGHARGDESALVARDTVTRRGQAYFRYPASGAARRAFDVNDLHFVQDVPAALAAVWNPGDVVWFAGRNLVARSSSNLELKGLTGTWYATPQGHRLHVGTPRALRALRDNVASSLAGLVVTYLFDRLEKNFGQAEAAFELYLAVENTAVPRRFLTSALYYFEMHDREAYDFEVQRAVLSGTFTSPSAFESELAQRRDWHRHERLDALTAGRDSHRHERLVSDGLVTGAGSAEIGLTRRMAEIQSRWIQWEHSAHLEAPSSADVAHRILAEGRATAYVSEAQMIARLLSETPPPTSKSLLAKIIELRAPST